MTLIHSPSIVRNGLVLHLDAANVKSYLGTGATWNDLSGNSNTSTLVNSPTYSNGYLTYNGSSQYVALPAILPAGRTTYTLSAWWYTTKNTGAQVVYEQNTSTLTTNRRSAILLNGASWGLNGESNDAHNVVPVRLNQWVNGVITVDTAATTNPVKIYENGVLYWQGNTNTNAINLNVGDSASSIGRKISTGAEYFQGNISNVSVYNKVLSASEVLQNFDALRGRYGV